MVSHKITPIVNQTAQVTNYPPEVIADVVKHSFGSLREYMLDPYKPGFRLKHFGVIRPFIKALNEYLKKLIKKMRLEPENEELKAKFRKYWKLRRMVQEDTKRRKFKERYGK